MSKEIVKIANEILGENNDEIDDISTEDLQRVYLVLRIVYIQERLKAHGMPVAIFNCRNGDIQSDG